MSPNPPRGKIRKFAKEYKKTFTRAFLTSMAATAVDFTVMTVLVEYLRVYYVTATAIGAVVGAITNFLLNRYWAFADGKGSAAKQGFRYALVSVSSLGMNTLLVYLFTDFLHIQYQVSKIVVSILVGWGWNYPLHRFFVFPNRKKK